MANEKRAVMVLSALPGPTTIGMHNPHYCECEACKPRGLLHKLTWKRATTRDVLAKEYGPEYSTCGAHLYRRKVDGGTVSFARVQTSKVVHLQNFYEIPEHFWRPCDAYGVETRNHE